MKLTKPYLLFVVTGDDVACVVYWETNDGRGVGTVNEFVSGEQRFEATSSSTALEKAKAYCRDEDASKRRVVVEVNGVRIPA